jgi:hypothetical protein
LGRIADVSVRTHYAADRKDRRAALFRPARGSERPFGSFGGKRSGTRRGKAPIPAQAMPETRKSDLARTGTSGTAAGARIREAGILLIACHNPAALEPVEHALEEVTLRTPEFAQIRDALLAALATEEEDVAAAIKMRIGRDPFELLERLPQARAHPLARIAADPGRVVEHLTEAIARHQAALALEAELSEAARDLESAEGEDWTWRVRQAGHLLQEAERMGTTRIDEAETAQVSDVRRLLNAEVYKSKKR